MNLQNIAFKNDYIKERYFQMNLYMLISEVQ